MPRKGGGPSGASSAVVLSMPVLFHDLDAMRTVRTSVAAWFADHQRSLPWRPKPSVVPVPSRIAPGGGCRRDAYGTWVCEIMSQQTRIQTVVEYWQRWMDAFPTVAALAAADSGQVRAMWAGLGYYRRAELLHKGAQYVVAHHNGELPRTAAALQNIPGIGPYTAGAIASICFNEMTPAVDGNVVRVLSRLGGAMDVDPKDPRHVRHVWEWGRRVMRDGVEAQCGAGGDGDRAKRNTPVAAKPSAMEAAHAGDVTEGLIELGATVCRPSGPPDCSACPLASLCGARAMLAAGDIEAIDGAIPMRGSKVAVSAQHVVAVAHAAVGPVVGGEVPQRSRKKQGDPLGASTPSARKATTAGRAETVYMLLAQRPPSGLLANMFEVPNLPLHDVQREATAPPATATARRNGHDRAVGGGGGGATVDDLALLRFPSLGATSDGTISTGPQRKAARTASAASVGRRDASASPTPQYLGQFVHKFSHIHMTVDVYAMLYASVDALHDVVAGPRSGPIFGAPRDVRVVSEHHRAEQKVAVAKIAETIFAMVRTHHCRHREGAECGDSGGVVHPVVKDGAAPRKRSRSSRPSSD